jgi:hypothetical protein
VRDNSKKAMLQAQIEMQAMILAASIARAQHNTVIKQAHQTL